jgi:predicted nucleic acid-binding protein
MTRVLDASAIIAHLDAHDAHHAVVGEVLDRAAGDALLAHPLTIAECLVAAVRDDRADEMIAAIGAMRVEAAEQDGGSPLRLAQLRVATGLRMPDCCALDVARHSRATLVTFDQRQAAAARGLGVAVEPATVPPGDG